MAGRNREKILDDIARVAGGTVSVVSGMTRSLRGEIRSRIDEAAMRLDLVPREEIERLEAVLLETRRIADEQARRIDALEAILNGKDAGQKKKAERKAKPAATGAAKKPAARKKKQAI